MKYRGGTFFFVIAFLFFSFPSLSLYADQQPRKFKHSEGHKPHLAKARVLFEEGQELLHKGKYDEAQEKFEEALELNPYHVVARKYIVLIQNRKHAVEIENQAISEEARMIEVRQEWLPPEKEKIVPEITPPWKVPMGVSEARKELEARSQQIIPAINFNNAHLSDVIKYLSKV